MAAKTPEKLRGFRRIPIAWEKKMKKNTGAETHKIVKRVDLLLVKLATVQYLSIDPNFEGDPPATFLSQWKDQTASGSYISLKEIAEFERAYFTGIDDTTPTAVKTKNQTRPVAINEDQSKGISVIIPTTVLHTLPAKDGKPERKIKRSISITFPSIFTHLMILQCLTSMIPPGKADKIGGFCRIGASKYPLFPEPVALGAKWGKADCGAWLLNGTFATTKEDPNIPGDTPDPLVLKA